MLDDRPDDAFRRDQHGDDEDQADDQNGPLGLVGEEIGDVADEAGAALHVRHHWSGNLRASASPCRERKKPERQR